jgi:colicin import membrane protein
MSAPTFEQKMAARRAGTVEVTVHPPAPVDGEPETRIAAKLARHAVEGRTEEERAAEAKAKAEAEESDKAKAKAKADDEAAEKKAAAEAKAKAEAAKK